jgi:hypothetical protein
MNHLERTYDELRQFENGKGDAHATAAQTQAILWVGSQIAQLVERYTFANKAAIEHGTYE